MKRRKEINKAIMEYFFRSNPFDENGKPIRGCKQRMLREWRERGMFESTEELYVIRQEQLGKNGWLSELEFEVGNDGSK